MPETVKCLCGCGRTFKPSSPGGHAKKFATDGCRHAIESAVRKWGMKAFEDGLIGLETLKPYFPSRAADTEASRDSGGGGVG